MNKIIESIMNEVGPYVKGVILYENGDIEEKTLDMTPAINILGEILEDRVSFVGQWEDEQVVIVKRYDQSYGLRNKHKLPKPYDNEIVNGPIILVRMDDNAKPKDFTLNEYHRMLLLI